MLLAVVLTPGSFVMGQGIAFRSVGPVNEGMAGVATGCPIDSAGAIHTNPASISGLPSSDISFAAEFILPTTTLSSSVGANALGPGVPPVNMSGSDGSETGVYPVPSMAMVHKSPDSPWAWGVGMFGIGGSSVNFPASQTNPILTPQPPNGIGLGRLSANVDVLQIVPTLSYEVNERLSVGFAPTVTMAKLYASPLFLGPKNDADHDGDATWSSGVGTRYAWGGGFKLGAYYTTDVGWHFGAAINSPQWMEPFRFKSEDQLGRPTETKYGLNYPLIASIGTSYSGFEDWVIGCDIRYFDYSNTMGFRNAGVSAQSAVLGLAWNSVMSVAVGAQRRINDHWTIRGGYCFNENPIGCDAEQFNVASPLIIQHSVHMGASYMFAENWIASLAYVHCFENSVTGPLHGPLGPIPNTSVTSTTSADAVSLGVSKRF